MAPVEAPSTFKRFVQVGRVVLVNEGPSKGKLAVIAEVIDHKRALIDGPTAGVPRQALSLKNLILTPYLLRKLPRAAGSSTVKKQFEASDVTAKWEASAWAKKRAAMDVRKKSSDFERFEIQLLKRAKRDLVRKAVSAEKKSA